MDTLYFKELPEPVDIALDLEMPQFSLVTSKVEDCSENYTSGFRLHYAIFGYWNYYCPEAIIMSTGE